MSLSLVDDFESPSRSSSRRRRRSPLVFNSPHSGRLYPRSFVAASRLDPADPAPLRGQLRRRTVRRRRRARRAADARALSRAPISTSTASPTSSIPACSRGGCRPSPTRARCGSPAGSAPSRASSAIRRRSMRGACPVEDALLRIEQLYKPYHRALQTRCCRRRSGASAWPSWSTATPCRRPRAAGTSTSRADFVIGDRYGTSASGLFCRRDRPRAARPRLHGHPQQALCRRLHHRALRQPGGRLPRPADRGEPRRSTWTSGASSGASSSSWLRATSSAPRPSSPRWRTGRCAADGWRRNRQRRSRRPREAWRVATCAERPRRADYWPRKKEAARLSPAAQV